MLHDISELYDSARDLLVLIHELVELCVLVMDALRSFVRHFAVCLLENNDEACNCFVQAVHALDKRGCVLELSGVRFEISYSLP